jgi:bifunctional enzyme CysN/CysC
VLFEDEIAASRGDILCHPEERPEVVDQFAAHLIWMCDERLLPGRSYLLKTSGRTIPATVTEIKHRLDINTQEKLAAKTLGLNEIGFCNLALTAPVAIDPYEKNRSTGAFILIDRFSNATAAAGMIAFPLRRATNIHPQDLTVGKADRARIKHQKPAILWFTGLSGAGKSTVANLVEAKLLDRHVHTILLDGDNVRHGLNKDLGFTDADRVENIRRIGEVAKLMVEAGLIVLCSFISPFKAERRFVRELVEESEFIEIFLDTPLDVCIARDPKGLYKRALSGAIKNFTGIDQVYETPENPELIIGLESPRPENAAEKVLRYLDDRNLFIGS